MSPEIIIAVISVLGIPVTMVIQWFLNKRKNKIDLTAALTGASQDAVETMLLVMNDLRQQVENLTKEAECLREENVSLRKETEALKAENQKLLVQIELLHVEIEKLRTITETRT